MVRDGLVCLTPKEVTVLGGNVQSLTEEWQMKKKYSSLSRSSGRQSQESKAGDGPPPFEELQIRTGSHHHGKQGFLVLFIFIQFSSSYLLHVCTTLLKIELSTKFGLSCCYMHILVKDILSMH